MHGDRAERIAHELVYLVWPLGAGCTGLACRTHALWPCMPVPLNVPLGRPLGASPRGAHDSWVNVQWGEAHALAASPVALLTYTLTHSHAAAPCLNATALNHLQGFGDSPSAPQLLRVDVHFAPRGSSGFQSSGSAGSSSGGRRSASGGPLAPPGAGGTGNVIASTFSDLIGRTAHIAVLESDAFAQALVWGVIRR